MSDANANEHGKGNGNGNGEISQQAVFGFAAGLDLGKSDLPPGLPGLERELARQVAILTVSVAQLVKVVEGQRKLLIEIANQLKEVLLPMAVENRRLQQREIDEVFIKPYVLTLIEIIDRHSAEITAAEKEAFSQVEELRQIDREELLQGLRRLDIVPFQPRGAKFDATLQTVLAVRPTGDRRKFGTIAKILRPGYRRISDGVVLRKIWVEVWGENAVCQKRSDRREAGQGH